MVSPHCERILKEFEDLKHRDKICWDFREIRAVVMCLAWKKMEEEHMPFREAIRRAWDEVKIECAEAGAYI